LINLFGFLYRRGLIKNDSVGHKIWFWKSNRWWNQYSRVPYHVLMGIKYGYPWEDITFFCKQVVKPEEKREPYYVDDHMRRVV
jgi:hypothetical protein